MFLPKRVYDALPATYIVTGFAVGSMMASPISFFSGCLFTLAGIFVFKMRVQA